MHGDVDGGDLGHHDDESQRQHDARQVRAQGTSAAHRAAGVTIAESDNKMAIPVCIGYLFQKVESPLWAPRRNDISPAIHRAQRKQELIHNAECNHRLASILSAATRRTCLLDYSSICSHLLQSSTDPSRVYTYRVSWRDSSAQIDSVSWNQQQSASPRVAGFPDLDTADTVLIGGSEKRIVRKDIATRLYGDVGRQWFLRQTACKEDAKTVWTRQNGLCAYCDVVTVPPDGEGVATCCRDYMQKTVFLSDTAKLHRMQEESNTEVGVLLFDKVLYPDRNVFVCTACAQIQNLNRLDTSLGFSHSEALFLETPVGTSDENIFFYMASCSGLHLVFSMFLCEVILTTSPPAVETEHVTIMAYVTNLREAELVYVNVCATTVDANFRSKLRIGLTLSHPNFANTTIRTLQEQAIDSNDDVTTISSRYHIFHCICHGTNRGLHTFLQERSNDECKCTGRLFVHVCQELRRSVQDVLSANSGQAVWELVRDELQHRFARRCDISSDDIAFCTDTTTAQHTTRRGNTILLARRNIRDRPSQSAQRIHNLSLHHGVEDRILDSIVLFQNGCPTPMMTLTQNGQHCHLYRLVAVCEIDGVVVHWLDVENWNYLQTMPTCDPAALRWFGTGGCLTGPYVFRDIAYSFTQLAQQLGNVQEHANTPSSADIEAARYVCFYERLTRHQPREAAVPIRMSSFAARQQAHALRKLFGIRSQILLSIRRAVAAKNTEPPAQSNTVFDEITQRCVRTMGVAIKLIGFIAINELHAQFRLPQVEPRDCHLLCYLLWNKFVIQEGFDAQTELVHEFAVLGQNIDAFGDMDLDAIIGRFEAFLTRQCDRRRASGRSEDVRDAFISAHTLLSEFHVVVASPHECATSRHAIQSLKIFESRIAKVPLKENYRLGNTKLMLHYFSCLFGFKILELYLLCIRETLV